jgi:hypothetical protein
MHFLRSLPVVYLCFVLVLSSSAQTPQRDAQAETVIQAALSALNGDSVPINVGWIASYQLQDVTPDLASQVTVTSLGPQLRTVTQTSAGTVTQVVSQGQVQTTDASGNRTTVTNLTLPGAGLVLLPNLELLIQDSNVNTQIVYVGAEQLAGTSVQHVQISRPLDPSLGLGNFDQPCDVYVDATSSTVSRISCPVHSASNLSSVSYVTTDYQNYTYSTQAGLFVPSDVYTSANGNAISHIHLTSLNWDTSVQPSLFVVQ